MMTGVKKVTAKIFSVLLALTMLLAILPTALLKTAAASSDDITFGVMSDLHYYPKSLMGSDMNAFINASKLGASTSYLADSFIDSAFAEYKAQIAAGKDIKYILIPGDLTKNGELAGHKALAQKFKAFEDETGVQIYVINGNHDIRNKNASAFSNNTYVSTAYTEPSEFRSIYADFGYNQADYTFTPPEGEQAGQLSYAKVLDGKYLLLALDGGCYSSDITTTGENAAEVRGEYSEALMNWALEMIKTAKEQGLTVIGLTHFNLVEHFECEDSTFTAFPIDDWQYVCEQFADAGMHYAFTGHIHMTDIASHTSDNGETLTDCSSASLLSFPNYLRTVTMSTDSDGNISADYQSTDIDNTLQIKDPLGNTFAKPFKYKAFELNFGGSDINQFAVNYLNWEITYNIKPEIKKYGSLYLYLDHQFDIDSVIDSLLSSQSGLGAVEGVSKTAIKRLIINICSQVESVYLDDPTHLLQVLDTSVRKITSIPVSDFPCTKYLDTLGFGEASGQGTLGDMVSSCLAYIYYGDEDSSDDPFINDALNKFQNGETADTIFNTLLDVVLHDIVEDELLTNIHIDVAGILKNTDDAEATDIVSGIISGIVDQASSSGVSLPQPSLMEVVNIVFGLGVVKYKSLDDVVNSLLDEYMTKSQMDTIANELYNYVSYFTQDTNPGLRMDNNSVISYNGKVTVVPTVADLRLPSGIAVTFGDNASTARNICWYTKKSVTGTDIEIVPYSKNPRFLGMASTGTDIVCDTELVTRQYPGIDFGVLGIINYQFGVQRHMISLVNLEPDTKYCYRVGDASKGWWSETGVIETADNSDSFTFFHMSDCQGGMEKQYNTWANVVDTAYNMYPDASFIMHTGDFVDYGSNFKQWNWMLNSASSDLMNTALMPTSGNHETKGDTNAITDNFWLSGIMNQDFSTGVHYSFDYNNAHFIVLNTNDLNSDGALSSNQLNWLKYDVGKTDKQWKIVALHKAVYSNGSHYDDDDVSGLRTQLSTLMPEFGIDIVLEGHDHVYLRTDAMNNNQVVSSGTENLSYNGETYTSKVNPTGTIYVIDGCSGVKNYQTKSTSATDSVFPRAEKTYDATLPMFSAIQIDGDNLYFDAYTVDNGKTEKIDSFAISKPVSVTDETTTSALGDNGTEADDEKTVSIPKTGKQVICVAAAMVPAGAAVYLITRSVRRKREDTVE